MSVLACSVAGGNPVVPSKAEVPQLSHCKRILPSGAELLRKRVIQWSAETGK